MTFPAGMPDIYNFEQDNPHLSINVFTHSEGEFFPIHSTNLNEGAGCERIGVNLVQNMTIDMTSGELIEHFYPVTNLSRFTQKKYTSKSGGVYKIPFFLATSNFFSARSIQEQHLL